MQYDVFISFKNLLPSGEPTRDSVLAREVHDHLAQNGLSVFLSNVALEQLGVSQYKRAIDDALDAAQVLVAVGTSRDHLESRWVRYEWDSFFNDILSDVKPSGRVFAYIEGLRMLDLPRSLRQAQTFVHGGPAKEALFNFIANALEKRRPPNTSDAPVRPARPVDPPSGVDTRVEHDVFFVYSHEDHDYVAEVARRMKDLGLTWTQNTMAADPPEVARLLAKSRFVVFVDSPKARGPFLYQELDVARGMGKPIIPLRIESVESRASGDPLRFVETIECLDARTLSHSEVAQELARLAGRLPVAPARPVVVDPFVRDLAAKFQYWMTNYIHEDPQQPDRMKLLQWLVSDRGADLTGDDYLLFSKLAEHLSTLGYATVPQPPQAAFTAKVRENERRSQ